MIIERNGIKMGKNYCGRYGCKNCEYHKVWYSNDYWSPDEHECIVPQNAEPDFELSDSELDNAIERAWFHGEEWNTYSEQICPFYVEYIEPLYD